MKEYDVIIIGGGPAGLSAAIYTSRGNHLTLVLDKGDCLRYKTGIIENYLGFPDGIDGQELVNLGCKHIKRFGSEVKFEEVLGVKINEKGNYVVKTVENEYEGKGLIIAMGVSYKKIKVKNLEKFEGKGISYCVICDGFFFRNKKVCVIGSKNYAAMEALELTNYTKDITIYTHGEKIEIDDILLRKLSENNIEIKENKIIEFRGDTVLKELVLDDGQVIPIDGVFIAVGSSGSIDIARKLGILIENNYIKVDEMQKTNLPRVYAAGDCTGGNRQIATAVGKGANAALNLISELRGIPYLDYKKSQG
ncbi:MAG: NAD(P)/FAD-dependent oxidoreductase [Candidatus Odinarchaeia archaeon]